MVETTTPLPLDPVTEDSESRKLWIGNLDRRVSEYLLLKLLRRYGPLQKFDMFHRKGPLGDQTRSFAFVTYASAESAKTAKENLHEKLCGNRVLIVKWAQDLSKEKLSQKQKTIPNIPALAGPKNETKLSKASTIQAIEDKLKNMEGGKDSLEFEINKIPMTSTNSVFINSSTVKSTLKNKKFVKHKKKPY